MSNSLDPDQDQTFVGPDLGPSYLQRLSADDKSPLNFRKEIVKVIVKWLSVSIRWFVLLLYVPLNSYGHGGTVSSLFPGQA